ncbi:MAG TPA: tetratricopeptide repeat protein, partial [Chitinophagaceae bacterium]|nr:tetratricopeptide repeat protein [Chitinophagaceae bacterium]
MKKLFLLLVIVMAIMNNAVAQVMPDVNRMMAMSAAERQKYADSLVKASTKNATDMATKYGLAIDETVLPGTEIKPPVKDVAKLSLIPSRPPTRTELVQQVQKSQQQLQSVMPKTEVAEIQKFSAQQSAGAIHEASIAKFYNNEPEKALYLMMEAAKQQPDSVIVWNNLGAMYNLSGLSHKAIPMLQYALQQVPGSSMILNNIAQSYLNLGDLVKARQYLEECLAIDSLNPDANHSMGMLHMFAKNFDEAMRCFDRELSVAMRAS